MNQKDSRNVLADVLETLAKILPTMNEAFCLAQAIFIATSSQDPKTAALIESHFERLLEPSKESVAQVLSAIQSNIAKLENDSLWNE